MSKSLEKTPDTPNRPVPAIVAFRDILRNNERTLKELAAGWMPPETLLEVMISAAQRNPELLQCTPESFLLAAKRLSDVRLRPGGIFPEAHLVPFKNTKASPPRMEVQVIPTAQGLSKCARAGGEIASITARVVHAKDTFDYFYDPNLNLTHRPYLQGDPGEFVGVYATARFKDPSMDPHFEFMSKAEVDRIKARARSGSGPWQTDYEEMAKKTVIKRLCKYLPMTDELGKAVDLDTRSEAGISLADAIDVEDASDQAALPPAPVEKPTKQSRLKDALLSQEEEPKAPADEGTITYGTTTQQGDPYADEPVATQVKAADPLLDVPEGYQLVDTALFNGYIERFSLQEIDAEKLRTMDANSLATRGLRRIAE